MKKALMISCIFIMLIIVFCIMKDRYATDSDKEKPQCEKIIESLEEKNIESLKKLFCADVKNTNEFESQITKVFDFIEGKIISYNVTDESLISASRQDGKIVKEEIGGQIDSVKTDEGKVYRIVFRGFTINEESTKKVGINYFAVYNQGTYHEKSGYPDYGKCIVGTNKSD